MGIVICCHADGAPVCLRMKGKANVFRDVQRQVQIIQKEDTQKFWQRVTTTPNRWTSQLGFCSESNPRTSGHPSLPAPALLSSMMHQHQIALQLGAFGQIPPWRQQNSEWTAYRFKTRQLRKKHIQQTRNSPKLLEKSCFFAFEPEDIPQNSHKIHWQTINLNTSQRLSKIQSREFFENLPFPLFLFKAAMAQGPGVLANFSGVKHVPPSSPALAQAWNSLLKG